MAAAVTSWDEVKRWRVHTRKSLIERRMAMSASLRNSQARAVIAGLVRDIDLTPYATVGIYWPIRGEVDVRGLAVKCIEAGTTIGLPVVTQPSAPLEFWRWHPGMGVRHDRAKIPIPAERELVVPEALLIPMVGFDRECYRLGYGGGYYDRTLAAFASKPFCIGLAYEDAELPTIYPQPHDIGMDVVVTSQSILRPPQSKTPL
jgi:5-formyltetrahydrofolate cyclo-ligase